MFAPSTLDPALSFFNSLNFTLCQQKCILLLPESIRKRPGKSPRLWESGMVMLKYRGLELARGAAANPRSD